MYGLPCAGGAANQELGLILSVYSKWQEQAVVIVQLSCVLRVAFAVIMGSKPRPVEGGTQPGGSGGGEGKSGEEAERGKDKTE